MSETFSIGWDSNEATQGLDEVIEKMADVEKQSGKLEEAGQGVVDSLERQITVVHKQASDWKSLGAVALPVLGQITHDGLHFAETIEEMAHATQHFAFEMGGEAIKSVLRMAEATVKWTLITKGAVSTIGAFRGGVKESTDATDKQGDSFLWTATKATALGTGVAILTGQFKASEVAASAFGIGVKTAVVGAGPVIAGAAAGLAVYTQVLKVTGERTDEFGNKSTNYDRVSSSMGRLGENVRAALPSVGEMGSALSQVAGNLPGVSEGLTVVNRGWKSFDEGITRSSDNMRDNIAIIGNWIGAAGDLERANARLEKMRADEVEHFKAVGAANEAAAESFRHRYEAERQGGIGIVRGSDAEVAKDKGLSSMDSQIDAEKRKSAAIVDGLNRQRDALDGSAKKEREYQQAVLEARRSLREVEQTTDSLIKKRRELALIPAGSSDLRAAFAKQTELEKEAVASIGREVERIQLAVGQKLISAKDYASQKAELDTKLEQINRDSLRRMYADQKAFDDDMVRSAKEAAEKQFQIKSELVERSNLLVTRQSVFARNVAVFERDFQMDIERHMLQRAQEGLKDTEKDRAVAHAFKEKQIILERDQAFKVIEDELAHAKASMTNKRQMEDADFAAQQRRQAAYLSAERKLRDETLRYAEEVMDKKKKAAADEVKLAKEKAEALKKAEEDKQAEIVKQSGVDGGAILKAQDPRQVRKNLIANAQKAAA